MTEFTEPKVGKWVKPKINFLPIDPAGARRGRTGRQITSNQPLKIKTVTKRGGADNTEFFLQFNGLNGLFDFGLFELTEEPQF